MPLTEQQLRIVESLQPAGEIAKVFAAGARIRNDPEFPARGYFLGHAMREMLNRLPDYYKGAASTADVTEDKSDLGAERIKALWVSWSSVVGGHIELTNDAPEAAVKTDVTIPFSLATEINSYLHDKSSVGRFLRDRITAFLADFQDTDRAFMVDIADGLMRLKPHELAHVPKPNEVRDESDAVEKWDHFERILLGLRGARHERYAEIAKEVDEWNSL